MTALRGLRSRAWAAIVVLVLVASAAVVLELRAGLRVWHETVGTPAPRAAGAPSAGASVEGPSGGVTLPPPPRPSGPAAPAPQVGATHTSVAAPPAPARAAVAAPTTATQ